ncbi:HEAT repeat domain-containing protein [bacterium]|nr:HEAT repeat domain-containing protein [bacterium]
MERFWSAYRTGAGSLIISVLLKGIICLLMILVIIGLFRRFSDDKEEYIKSLESGNPVVISDAIYRLGEIREKSAVPRLARFLNDKSKEIRIKAIEALGKIGDSGCVDDLIAVLAENDKEIQRKSVESLGKIKDDRSTLPLIGLLEDNDLQIFVIWSLGNIGDKRAVPALTRLLDSQDKYIRFNAGQSLKKIGDKST